MLKGIRPGTAIALVALFVALAGGAWAAATIGSGDIKKNAVRGKHIKKGQVKTQDIGKGAVKAKQLADNAVGASKLTDDAVGTAELADGAVTEPKIAAGAVSEAKLADAVADEVKPTGRVTIAGGQTQTVLSSGPFTIDAVCTTNGAERGIDVRVSSTEANSIFFGEGGASGISNPQLIGQIPPAGVAAGDGSNLHFVAPSGATLSLNIGFYSDPVAGNCQVVGYGVS